MTLNLVCSEKSLETSAQSAIVDWGVDGQFYSILLVLNLAAWLQTEIDQLSLVLPLLRPFLLTMTMTIRQPNNTCNDLWIWDWQRHLKRSITIKFSFFHCISVYDVQRTCMMMQTLHQTNTTFHYMTVWVFTMLVSDGPLTVTLASSSTALVNTLAETLIVFT